MTLVSIIQSREVSAIQRLLHVCIVNYSQGNDSGLWPFVRIVEVSAIGGPFLEIPLYICAGAEQ